MVTCLAGLDQVVEEPEQLHTPISVERASLAASKNVANINDLLIHQSVYHLEGGEGRVIGENQGEISFML